LSGEPVHDNRQVHDTRPFKGPGNRAVTWRIS
jgi:hypothetical protein